MMVKQVGPASGQPRTNLAFEAAVIDWLPGARIPSWPGVLGTPATRPEIRLQSAPLHHSPTTTNGAWNKTAETNRRHEVLSDYDLTFSLDRRSPDTACSTARCRPTNRRPRLQQATTVTQDLISEFQHTPVRDRPWILAQHILRGFVLMTRPQNRGQGN